MSVSPTNVLRRSTPAAKTNEHESFASVDGAPRLKGFLWAIAAPMAWLVLFYGFVVHVRLSLGGWPDFGKEHLAWPLFAHYKVAEWLAIALFFSLYAVPFVLLATLCRRRWRHVSWYLLCYGAAVGAALAAVLLAPNPILNWIFD